MNPHITRLKEARSRVAEIAKCCRPFRMSIPAESTYDDDLFLSERIDGAAAEIERLEAEISAVRKALVAIVPHDLKSAKIKDEAIEHAKKLGL